MPSDIKIEADVLVDTANAEKNLQRFALDAKIKLDPVKLVKLEWDFTDVQFKADILRKRLNELKREPILNEWEIKKTQRALNTVTKEVTEARARLNNFRNTGDETMSRFRRTVNGANSAVRQLWASIVGVFSFWAVTSWLKTLTDEVNSFESAFAWFAKTLDAPESQLREIEKWIVSLSKSIPLTTEELSRIAEAWGQMWVAADDILIFTETVAKLSSAISWVSAEEASQQLARVLALSGESIQNIDELSNSLVALWNNFKANEWEILNFWERLTSAGAIVWLTSSEILWIATAFVDVWIQAEAWGTAVQKTLLTINNAVLENWEALRWFAETAWVSSQEFANTWENDAWEWFRQFVEWLSEEWDDAINTINDLIWTDVRLQRALLAVANANGVLTKSMELSNSEFENWTALQDEFAKRLQTNTAQLAIQANRWAAWRVSVTGSLASARVTAWEFFLKFFPSALAVSKNFFAALINFWQQAFSSIQIWIIRTKSVVQIWVNNIAWVFVWLWTIIAGVVTWIIDIWRWLANNADILWRNIAIWVGKLVPWIRTSLNSWIKLVENFLNKAIDWVNSFAQSLWFEWVFDRVTLLDLDVNTAALQKQFVSFEKVTFDSTQALIKNSAAVVDSFQSRKAEIQSAAQAEIDSINKVTAERAKGLKNFFATTAAEARVAEESRTQAKKDFIESEENKQKELEKQLANLVDTEDKKTGASKAGNKARWWSAKDLTKQLEAEEKKRLKAVEQQEKKAFEERLKWIDRNTKQQELWSKSIEDNLLTQQRRLNELRDLEEEYAWDKEKTQKVQDEILKTLSKIKDIDEDLVDESRDKWKSAYDDLQKAVRSAWDAVEKTTDAIEDNTQKLIDMREEARKTIQEINNDISEIESDEDVDLADRSLEIDEERLKILEDIGSKKLEQIDNDLDAEISAWRRNRLEQKRLEELNKIDNSLWNDSRLTWDQSDALQKLNELNEEKAFIEWKITQELVDQRKAVEDLSEAERIRAESQDKIDELNESKLLQDAIVDNREIKIEQDDEDWIKAFVENEKGELIELQNFKNLQRAVEFQEERLDLQTQISDLKEKVTAEAIELKRADDERRKLEQAYSQFLWDEVKWRIDIQKEYIDNLRETIELLRQTGVSIPTAATENNTTWDTNDNSVTTINQTFNWADQEAWIAFATWIVNQSR